MKQLLLFPLLSIGLLHANHQSTDAKSISSTNDLKPDVSAVNNLQLDLCKKRVIQEWLLQYLKPRSFAVLS